ncbi:hypothetical protein [Hyphobacterium sp.]|uniref:hypothetical protein n=1 Tax=Hyphobacterium sp. TaxID=2004662 RepID=UPI003B525FD7
MTIPGLSLLTSWKAMAGVAVLSSVLSAWATQKIVNNAWEARQLNAVVAYAEHRDKQVQTLLANQGRLSDRNVALEASLAEEQRADDGLFETLRREREADDNPVLDMPLPDSSVDRVRCAWRPSDAVCRRRSDSGTNARGSAAPPD